MYILGISCYYHDSAAALIKDGIIIAAAEEERFSRIKHDNAFPSRAIAFCLRKAGIKSGDLAYVVFYEKPFLKFERIFLTAFAYAPYSYGFFRESMKEWFFDKLWIKTQIIKELDISQKQLLFSEHHISHAASSFFCSPFEKAALLSVDGVGEWTTTSWGIGNGTKLELKEEIRFPHSLGLLYSTFTTFTGFEVNEGEYKVMGLAPYGKPKYVEEIYKLMQVARDGSFYLRPEYFSYPYSLKGIYTKKFEEIFGTANTKSDEVIPYYADIAASIQVVLEEELIKIANYVYEKTGLEHLCFAGGVALNSAANWKILNKTKFKELFIQPAAGDSGGALGAALWTYHTVLGNKRTVTGLPHVYFGESEEDEATKQFLKKENIAYKKAKTDEQLIETVVEKMSQGKVIGWVQDAFEWGPRSLGHRSILADPRTKEMKDIVNRKIKFREAFRPFAPSVILEKAPEYFETKGKESHSPFQFMLYVLPVEKSKRGQLGAITHMDGTARPQFVQKAVNPRYHTLIKAFGEKTGVPVVLNTSFNLKGEPIVNTSKEAFHTFQKSGIDTLVINNYIIEK